MENASKALIIAGAILLSILIIGIGMFIYQQATEAIEGANMSSEQIAAYNAEFSNYEGTQSGSSVRALCDRIRNHNSANQEDTSRQIGISYEGKGKPKEDGNIDDIITSRDVNAVKTEMKSGKRYKVSFVESPSTGLIISATIEDATTGSSST